ESKVKRDKKALDTHIHACLYFLDTTHSCLSDLDRFALRSLSSRVNVIPVIGKADTLSRLQQGGLKKGLRKDIFDTLQIPIYGFIELEDDEEEEEECTVEKQNDKKDNKEQQQDEECRVEAQERGSFNMTHILQRLREYADDEDEDARTMVEYLEHMPYTVIGYEGDPDTGRPLTLTPDQNTNQQDHQEENNNNDSNELNLVESGTEAFNNDNQQPKRSDSIRSNRRNKGVLGRQYPWAVVECCNPDHCDLEKLHSMIVSSHRDMLRIDTFERFYENYRTEKLLRRRVDKLTATETKNGKILA
ncbi:hypothetical protein INT45_014026, partial [Circinella minor]